LNFIRLASRIDAVASRVETAVRMRTVTGSMANIVRGMEQALQTMDMQKITMVMDKFEQQFEDLDVQGQYVENSMNQTTALSTPQEEVDSLISQVADEYGLQLSEKIAPSPLGAPSVKAQQKEEQDDLFARLNNLKAT